MLVSSTREDKGSFAVTADQGGRYTYCFSNKLSAVSVKSVNFNAFINEKNELNENSTRFFFYM